MKVERSVRIGAVVVVTLVSVKLMHDLRTNTIPGEQWPTRATLDSLRPYVQREDLGVDQIESFAYDDLSRHDPFMRAQAVPEPTPEPVAVPRADSGPRPAPPRVSAILISGDRKVAVVNNTLVRIGSTLPDGTRIVGIERDHVQIISRDGANIILRLNNGG